MPTKNIECQLAQGQIGRYLNGERFSPIALKQLESHVADCDDCSELVTRRRQALMSMLGERTSNLAVVNASSFSDTNREAGTPRTEIPETTGTPSTPKPAIETADTPANKIQMFGQVMNSKLLLYCTGLAIVLLGMSYFSRGALKAFGPTVDQTPLAASTTTRKPTGRIAPRTAAIPAPAASAHPIAKAKPPVAKKIVPVSNATPTLASPIVHRSPLAKQGHRLTRSPRHLFSHAVRNDVRIRVLRSSSRRHPATTTRHRWTNLGSSHAFNSGIRLYDPQGRPIQ